MPHLSTPGPDTGHFSTTELHPPTHPSSQPLTRAIRFSPAQYADPPRIAAGFSTLHLAHTADLRAAITLDQVSAHGMRIGARGAALHEAAVCWIEARQGARDSRFGTFDTRDVWSGKMGVGTGTKAARTKTKSTSKAGEKAAAEGEKTTAEGEEMEAEAEVEIPLETEHRIAFDPPFAASAGPIAVVCWLRRLDVVSGGGRNYRLHVYATDADHAGFVAHVDAWGDTALRGAGLSWIAVPAGKSGVACGEFGTADVRSWSEARSRNEGRIVWPRGRSENKAPATVLVGVNMFDYAGNADLRVRVAVEDVGAQGARWRLDAWGDSTLYAASASWIALA